MSLSDLASFAVSGSAATALAALITNRLVPDERRGRPRQRDRARARAAASAPPVAARSAASGFVFFLTYFIAATARYSSSSSGSNGNGNGNSAPRSTGRAASDAFIVGATASVFARLFGPHPDAAVTPAGHRWSMPALEDDLVLAIDPGLTFAVHEILARVVARILSHRRQQQQQQQRYLGASVTTFLLAATSKALVTALTYPLHVAAAEATERRYSAAVAALAADAADADDDDEPLIMLTDDSAGNGTHTQAAGRRTARQDTRDGGDSGGGGRRHNILVVLLQMLRAEGPRPLYVGWLRAVVAAALGHGLTMALQRSIYAYLLRLVHASRQLPSPPPSQQPRTPTHVDRPDGAAATTAASPASSQPPRRAKTSPRRQQPAADHFEVPPASVLPTMPPAPPAPPAPAASSSPLPPPPPPPPQPQPPTPAPFADEDRMKVKNAVESWLESSSVASEGTVQCDDSISNVSSRHHPRPRHQPTKPAASTSTRRQHASSSSRASPSSRTSAFYPDAPPAISRLAAHVRAGRSRDRNDIDEDDSGSLIFNMVSKSPRVIRVGTDDL